MPKYDRKNNVLLASGKGTLLNALLIALGPMSEERLGCLALCIQCICVVMAIINYDAVQVWHLRSPGQNPHLCLCAVCTGLFMLCCVPVLCTGVRCTAVGISVFCVCYIMSIFGLPTF